MQFDGLISLLEKNGYLNDKEHFMGNSKANMFVGNILMHTISFSFLSRCTTTTTPYVTYNNFQAVNCPTFKNKN